MFGGRKNKVHSLLAAQTAHNSHEQVVASGRQFQVVLQLGFALSFSGEIFCRKIGRNIRISRGIEFFIIDSIENPTQPAELGEMLHKAFEPAAILRG